MMALAFLFAMAAFAACGLSTDEHHGKRLHGRITPARKRALRGVAWAGLALCFACSVAARGWVVGPVLWFGVISFGAALVFLTLNLAPQRSRKS